MTPSEGPESSPRILVLSPGLRKAALVLLALGLLVRVVPLAIHPTNPLTEWDGTPYWHLAQNLAAGRGFVITRGDLVSGPLGVDLGPSHHFSPLLPAVEAGFIWIFGPQDSTVGVAAIAITLSSFAAIFWATRDLLGHDAALLVTAAASWEWTSVVYGSWLGQAENLILAFLTLTLWALVRSVNDPRFVVLAGLFAGLGYLTKASIGWFFLIAGLGGALWRVFHWGWKGLLNRWYGLAIATFGVFVGAWSLRNLYLFWDGTLGGLLVDWQTSVYIAKATDSALSRPADLATALVIKPPVLLLGLLVPHVALLPRARAAFASIRQESVSVLFLCIALIFLLGWILAAIFHVHEGTPWRWLNHLRYVTPAQIPLLWLVVARAGRPSTSLAWGWLLAFSAFQVWWVRDHSY